MYRGSSVKFELSLHSRSVLVLESAISQDNDHDHRGKRILVSQEDHDTDHEVKRILIQDNYYSIMSKLEALAEKVGALTAENGNLALEVQRLKSNTASSGNDVAFFAKLTKAVNGSNHVIHYDDVILNIGNAYNPNHGTFVAPVNGTYHFDMYICSADEHVVILSLMVNNDLQTSLLSYDTGIHSCTSNAYTVSLKAGDDVNVKTMYNADNIMKYDQAFGLPSFSGFLIRAH